MKVDEARRRIRAAAHLNAFISLTEEEGEGPVVAVKDNVDVRGTVTTAGARSLPAEPAARDAPVVARLRECGCVVVGKTNLHEWALGGTSANRHHGSVVNPRSRSRIPGGSSGGSAAAVAAGLCDWAIGTDTGGSIRCPASFCGVVGIRPGPGLVETEGVFPNAPSFDSVGPMAADVTAAARALEMMSGVEGLLPARVPAPDRLRLAVPRGWVFGLDRPTARAWEQAAGTATEIRFPDRAALSGAFAAIFGPEVASVHRRRLAADPGAYEAEIGARIRGALETTAVDYLEARALRERDTAAAEAGLDGWDALLLPTAACAAPLVGEEVPDLWEKLGRFTRPVTVLGQPVITLPMPGSDPPVGIQVVGRLGRETELIGVALALERAWALEWGLEDERRLRGAPG